VIEPVVILGRGNGMVECERPREGDGGEESHEEGEGEGGYGIFAV